MQEIPGFISNLQSQKIAIISDDNVSAIYGRQLTQILAANGLSCLLLTFKHGDASKNISTAATLLEKLSENGLNRNSLIIALGGGVSGDLSGFIASIFMRGINYIQVPTSLLAMVDASIGGKTAVNLATGKNMAGTFHQPKAVFIDPGLLSTLPVNEYLYGLSEVIKTASIADKELFALIEANIGPILERNSEILTTIIERTCSIKASIVEKDEKEKNLRMILNYGHTIGHAVEILSKYKISHGEAVAFGIKLVNIIAINKGLAKTGDMERINNLIDTMSLVTAESAKKASRFSSSKIWDIIGHDKKTSDSVNFIVVPEIGKAEIATDIDHGDVARALKQYI